MLRAVLGVRALVDFFVSKLERRIKAVGTADHKAGSALSKKVTSNS